MIKMNYVCLECETEFDQPIRYQERHGLDAVPFEELNVCPHCGSDYYIPAEHCDLCGKPFLDEYIITIDNVQICNNCYIVRSVDGGY